MNLELRDVVGIVALLVAFSNLAFGRRDKSAAVITDLERRVMGLIASLEKEVHALSSDVDVLKVQMLLIFKDLTVSSASKLHSPHTPDLDRLLEKYQQDRLERDELIVLIGMLEAIYRDETESVERRMTAGQFLVAIRFLFSWGMQRLATRLPTIPHADLKELIREQVPPGPVDMGVANPYGVPPESE